MLECEALTLFSGRVKVKKTIASAEKPAYRYQVPYPMPWIR